jgi:hypothetical protein
LFHGAFSNLLVHKLHNTIALAYVQMCKDLRHGVFKRKLTKKGRTCKDSRDGTLTRELTKRKIHMQGFKVRYLHKRINQ